MVEVVELVGMGPALYTRAAVLPLYERKQSSEIDSLAMIAWLWYRGYDSIWCEPRFPYLRVPAMGYHTHTHTISYVNKPISSLFSAGKDPLAAPPPPRSNPSLPLNSQLPHFTTKQYYNTSQEPHNTHLQIFLSTSWRPASLGISREQISCF